MKNLNIFARLFISHTAIGLFVVVILSVVFYLFMRNALIQRTVDQLSSINILEKDLIRIHLLQLKSDLQGLKQQNILYALYERTRDETQIRADEQSFDELLKFHGFENIWAFDNAGKLLFSTRGDSLTDIPHAMIRLPDDGPDTLKLLDATPYLQTPTTVLLYVMAVTRDGERLGSMVAQLDFQKIQTILFEQTGMGASGESYIVADDFRMRSTSRFFPERIPYTIVADSEPVHRVLDSMPDEEKPFMVKDYRGVEVLSVYRSVDIPGLNWVILSEMDLDEAMRPIIGLRNSLIGVTFLLMLAAMLITYVLSNAISKPVLQVKQMVVSLARGVIPARRAEVTSYDEIGQMAEAINQLTEALRRSTEFANAIGLGRFDAPYEKLSDRDSLGTALIRMRNELKGFNEREHQLAMSRAAALLEGQELERKRITLELHDGVGQLLTAIKMRVEMLDGDEGKKEGIKAYINDTIAEVRRISYNVMPQALVDYGLKAAVSGLCDNIRKYSGLAIDFNWVEEVAIQLDFDVSIAVFRIVQEGLNNIVKHARATHVEISLVINEDNVYLILADNGNGFEPAELKQGDQGFGLRNMRERARLLNGTFEITSSPGQGTVIEVSIPVQPIKSQA